MLEQEDGCPYVLLFSALSIGPPCLSPSPACFLPLLSGLLAFEFVLFGLNNLKPDLGMIHLPTPKLSGAPFPDSDTLGLASRERHDACHSLISL